MAALGASPGCTCCLHAHALHLVRTAAVYKHIHLRKWGANSCTRTLAGCRGGCVTDGRDQHQQPLPIEGSGGAEPAAAGAAAGQSGGEQSHTSCTHSHTHTATHVATHIKQVTLACTHTAYKHASLHAVYTSSFCQRHFLTPHTLFHRWSTSATAAARPTIWRSAFRARPPPPPAAMARRTWRAWEARTTAM